MNGFSLSKSENFVLVFTLGSLDVLYCTTPALDGYPLQLDKTHHTQVITSLSICGMDFNDLWHHCLHLSSSASILISLPTDLYFCPSWPTHITHHWLISTTSAIIYTCHDLGLILWFQSLWREDVECDGRQDNGHSIRIHGATQRQ